MRLDPNRKTSDPGSELLPRTPVSAEESARPEWKALELGGTARGLLALDDDARPEVPATGLLALQARSQSAKVRQLMPADARGVAEGFGDLVPAWEAKALELATEYRGLLDSPEAATAMAWSLCVEGLEAAVKAGKLDVMTLDPVVRARVANRAAQYVERLFDERHSARRYMSSKAATASARYTGMKVGWFTPAVTDQGFISIWHRKLDNDPVRLRVAMLAFLLTDVPTPAARTRLRQASSTPPWRLLDNSRPRPGFSSRAEEAREAIYTHGLCASRPELLKLAAEMARELRTAKDEDRASYLAELRRLVCAAPFTEAELLDLLNTLLPLSDGSASQAELQKSWRFDPRRADLHANIVLLAGQPPVTADDLERWVARRSDEARPLALLWATYGFQKGAFAQAVTYLNRNGWSDPDPLLEAWRARVEALVTEAPHPRAAARQLIRLVCEEAPKLLPHEQFTLGVVLVRGLDTPAARDGQALPQELTKAVQAAMRPIIEESVLNPRARLNLLSFLAKDATLVERLLAEACDADGALAHDLDAGLQRIAADLKGLETVPAGQKLTSELRQLLTLGEPPAQRLEQLADVCIEARVDRSAHGLVGARLALEAVFRAALTDSSSPRERAALEYLAAYVVPPEQAERMRQVLERRAARAP